MVTCNLSHASLCRQPLGLDYQHPVPDARRFTDVRKIIDLLLPVVASPALVLFLKLLPFFDLRPMAYWTFDAEAPKFIVAAVAAIFAYPRLSLSRRLWFLGGGLVLFLVCLLVYDYLSDMPRTAETKDLYHTAAFVTFFGYYFTLGYCAAHVCKFFTQRNPKPVKHA